MVNKKNKYEIIKLDVLDTVQLKKYGYDTQKYYVGPWAFMSFLTKIRDFLENFGIEFPFNVCAFKHDMLYHIGGSIWWKFRVDFTFLLDMLKVLNHTDFPPKIKKRLLIRALVFYFIVVLATPIYLFTKEWRLPTSKNNSASSKKINKKRNI